MPLIETKGAASAQGFGEFAASSGAVTYIEDVFSTYLYTGNGSTQTITNGIDLSTKGGMVWLKARSAISYNLVTDSARGAGAALRTESTAANQNIAGRSFYTNGFDVNGSSNNFGNGTNTTYVSWTFRKQPKFFDVVTYTGNGTTQNIAHNLGSVPGCIIVKEASAAGNDWQVYHRSTTNTCGRLFLNLTNAENATGRANTWGDNTNPVPPTSTVFTVGNTGAVNNNGATFVAYLFAHDAGGFPANGGGSTNGISCGSYTGNGSTTGPEINLGYEPQWLLIKNTTTSGYDWWMFDVMRGWTNTSSGDNTSRLTPDSSQAEDLDRVAIPTATGFRLVSSTTNYNGSGNTYIYIAIRRGPMKVPTSGTSVFTPVTYTGNGATTRVVSTTITPDAGWFFHRDNANGEYWFDRLRGGGNWLQPSTTGSESSWTGAWLFDVQNAVQMKSAGANYINGSGALNGLWALKRAPSFFDEVCYTGTGTSTAFNHNLTVVPEMMIIRRRNSAGMLWVTYAASQGNTKFAYLNSDQGFATDSYLSNTTPTSSVFTVGTNGDVNASGGTYVAYLFATCAGVSKVGSYTGTGALQTVNCGFTGGARFVLIKRTDSTGDWYVYDSARGITSGNDPYLFLNSADAEVTGTNYVDTDSTGFKVTAAAPAGLNASGGTYIFLAIA